MAIESIEFEEIKDKKPATTSETQAAVIETIDDQIKHEIKKFNIADAAIEALKQQYSALTISGIEDREGYKKTHSAWQEVRNKRIAIEKKHKEIKADYLQVSRAIDGEKNRLIDLISPLEKRLGGELERIDGLIEAKKQRAEREAQERLQTRVATLLDNGIQFNGSFYAIGETITVDVVTLKNLRDDEFNQLLQRVQAENKKILDAKAEAERKEREEREALQRQKEEQERQAEQLRQQREEMERQQAEMKKQRTDLRVQILQNAGFVMRSDLKSLVFTTLDAGHIFINFSDFEDLEGDAWDQRFFNIRADINKLRTLQSEKDAEKAEQQRQEELRQKAETEKRQRWHDRAKELFSLGMHERNGEFYIITDSFGESNFYKASEIFELEDEAWTECLKVIDQKLAETRRQDKENIKRAADEKEAERIAAMSDTEILNEYFVKIAELKAPELKNTATRAAFTLFVDSFYNAKQTLFKTLELINKK